MTPLALPLTALDRARAGTLRLLGPLGRPLLADRELRVAVYGVSGAAVALCLTVLFPLQLLVVGPLLLGVPHLLADARYLVAKPGLHRRAAFWALCAAPACAAWIWPHASLGFAAVLGAALAARASEAKRAIAAILAAALIAVCTFYGPLADVVMAHAHNVIAVALFAVWARRRTSMHWAPLAAFAIGSALLFGGAFDRHAYHALGRGFVDPSSLLSSVAPVRGAAWSTRLLLFFAFAQSMHYGVWLRLVPEQDRERPGMRSFTSSLRALVRDLDKPLVAAGALVALALLLWSVRSLEAARLGYLRLALFHGPLELGAATLLLLEGRLPKPASQ